MKTRFRLFALLGLCAAAMASCSEDAVDPDVPDSYAPLYDINRAALMKMDTGQPITVVGHKSQDPDAVCSAIAMAALMQELGMDATPYMQEKPIQGVKFILDYTGYAAPEVRTAIEPGMPLVMTDHNDYMQALEGTREANVVGIVDHHGISSSFSSNVPIYCKFMNVGSANTIIYTIYRECGIVPRREIARLMVAGIIADTDSLAKATCTSADSIALSQLCQIAQFSSMSELTQGIMLAQDSFDGLTDEEIFLSDVKTYEIGGVKLAITSLDANMKMHVGELCERMRAVMPQMADRLGVQMVFAKMEESLKDENGAYILDAEGNKQYTTHFSYYGEGARELAEEAYGQRATDRENDCIILSSKLSRKTDIVPDLTRILEDRHE